MHRLRKLPPTAMFMMAAGVSGCYGTSLCDEASGFTASATLGTGQDAFEELAEGDTLRPAFGAQGGYHLWAGVRTTGLDPGAGSMVTPPGPIMFGGMRTPVPRGRDPVTLTTMVRFDEEDDPGIEGEHRDFLTGTPEMAEHWGITAFVDPWDLSGEGPHPASLTISVTDGCGTTVEDSRNILVDLDE